MKYKILFTYIRMSNKSTKPEYNLNSKINFPE